MSDVYHNENMVLAFLRQDGRNIRFIDEKTPEICLEAVKQNGLALEFIENQTEELCLEAVKKNGLALEFVKNQTEEMCLEAVKKDSWAIEFVKDQTEKICLASIDGGMSFMHIEKITYKIAKKILEKDGLNLQYIKNKYPLTNELRLIAIKENGWAILSTPNPTEEMSLEAYKENQSAKKYFKIPLTNEMIFEMIAHEV